MNTKRSFQIKKFIGDRAFYKRYLMLALPMNLTECDYEFGQLFG